MASASSWCAMWLVVTLLVVYLFVWIFLNWYCSRIFKSVTFYTPYTLLKPISNLYKVHYLNLDDKCDQYILEQKDLNSSKLTSNNNY